MPCAWRFRQRPPHSTTFNHTHQGVRNCRLIPVSARNTKEVWLGVGNYSDLAYTTGYSRPSPPSPRPCMGARGLWLFRRTSRTSRICRSPNLSHIPCSVYPNYASQKEYDSWDGLSALALFRMGVCPASLNTSSHGRVGRG